MRRHCDFQQEKRSGIEKLESQLLVVSQVVEQIFQVHGLRSSREITLIYYNKSC